MDILVLALNAVGGTDSPLSNYSIDGRSFPRLDECTYVGGSLTTNRDDGCDVVSSVVVTNEGFIISLCKKAVSKQ